MIDKNILDKSDLKVTETLLCSDASSHIQTTFLS